MRAIDSAILSTRSLNEGDFTTGIRVALLNPAMEESAANEEVQFFEKFFLKG